MKLIDATNLKIGRLASHVAKMALNGEEINIINAEFAVITGTRQDLINSYLEKRDVGSRYKGPFFPKKPDRILKRTIRGMLPYKEKKGREALSRVKTFLGRPEEFDGLETETIEGAKIKMMEKRKYLVLGELSQLIGG